MRTCAKDICFTHRDDDRGSLGRRAPPPATTSKTALARGARRCPACGREQEAAAASATRAAPTSTARYRKPRLAAHAARRPRPARSSPPRPYPLVAGLRDDAAAERERPPQRQAALKAAERARLPREPSPVARRRAPAAAPAPTPSPSAREQVADAEAQITADAPRARRRRAGSTATSRAPSASRIPRTAARRAIEADPARAARPLRVRRLHAEVRRARSRRARSARGSSATPTGS